ncbi:putative thiol oxidase [Helianthus annuus]|nr:thiol oxidase isoform 2 precursor [Helianthus annuus]KAF5778592.1 putative thiol oxidase [Helianthus annuus]KAJ0489976.1 putative thiol oxidase [Helianthus annuus]KAJ0494024.1 putative thiol oxidase [Helianthus annuus]KAJ0675564.1 putative thiol oxidase [Helianthus annuus]KAJ0678840.1 putative thiol oxidase [Helianthus annuus]
MSSLFNLLTTFLLLWTFVSLNLLSSALLINPAAGSRSLLRVVDGAGNQPGFAVDLNVTNFDQAFKDATTTYAIVEFFAHWCPACRNYKPQYEKVARLFNGANAAHPGIIFMTRVDCADTINTKLCDKFSVTHYPSLYWGPPSKFVGGGWDGKDEKSEIRFIDDGRTADRLLKWINSQLGSSYKLEDEKHENDHVTRSNVSDPGQIAQAVYDVEEATIIAFDMILENKMVKPESRGTLIKFMQLMVSHHPSRRCRRGTADILVNFDDLYLSKKHGLLDEFGICGKEASRGYWTFCRGSTNDTRGFSCGLWVLLHSISVRVEDGESQMAFTTTCDFIHQFFNCEECSEHFYNMCSRVSTPFGSKREYVLWLWTAHNEVNKRLKNAEESLKTSDPKFPKTIWPTKRLCPTCYNNHNQNEESSSIDWNHDEVFKFLSSYYGNMLVSLYKENDEEQIQIKNNAVSEQVLQSTNALVVPAGAALAIAAASCLFGALAWFWRSRQKNRKYFHKPQPLKIV